jgi:catechol 2,3-dioxygenase-like lactoylglutathione lyase family enzyme
MSSVPTLRVTEIKAFVPSKNFEQSKQFYQDIGFTMASEGGGVAYFHCNTASFLLRDFCAESFAENFMMHILVEDVEAWWNHVNESGVVAKFGVNLAKIELQPWRMRDFCLTDPSGVLWRIGQNVK